MEAEIPLPHSKELFPSLMYDNPVNVSPTHFLKTHFNIILPSMSSTSKCSLSFGFPHQTPVCSSPVLHACYSHRPFHSASSYHHNHVINFQRRLKVDDRFRRNMSSTAEFAKYQNGRRRLLHFRISCFNFFGCVYIFNFFTMAQQLPPPGGPLTPQSRGS